MERKIKKANVAKAGGTAGKSAISYRMQLPTNWMKRMGFTETDRDAEVSYDPDLQEIIIRKVKIDESNCD